MSAIYCANRIFKIYISIYLINLCLVLASKLDEKSIFIGTKPININYIKYDGTSGQLIYLLFSNEKDVNYIDYNAAKNLIVWSNLGIIKYVKLTNEILRESKSIQNVNTFPLTFTINKNEQNYKTFTVDWIHNLIFYVSREEKQILVPNLTVSNNNLVIVKNTKNFMQDIKVDPINQYIFWTQWDTTGESIELMRSNLDGSQQKNLLNNSQSVVLKFTIDTTKSEIYIFNTTIYIIDFDGNHISFNNIIALKQLVNVELDYCNHNLFIADMSNGYVTIFDTTTHELVTKISLSSKPIYSFKVVHNTCQNQFKNNILVRNQCLNNDCSHICVPLNNSYYGCLCPENDKKVPNKDCKPKDKLVLTFEQSVTETFNYLNTRNSNMSTETTSEISKINSLTQTSNLTQITRNNRVSSNNFIANQTSTEQSAVTNSSSLKVTIILIIVIGLIAAIVYTIFYYSNFHNIIIDRQNQILNETQLKNFERVSENNTNEQQIENETSSFIKNYSNPLEIDISNLKFDTNNKIGSGQFGVVYRGVLIYPYMNHSVKVAIKTLKMSNVDEDAIRSFLEEGLRMEDFNHKNVLRLIGYCFDENNIPLIITPYMENGDMLTYIRNKYIITNETLIGFAIQVANGMKYLSRKRVVHIDLAARNCMLDENLNVKIADFGLSRDIYLTGNYKTYKSGPFPFKWIAMECFEGRAKFFDEKTDVWSFGILVWELMTRGDNPYFDQIEAFQLLCFLKSGHRLPKPDNCPSPVYLLMRKCWFENPLDRPRFCQLYNEFTNILNEIEIQNKLLKMNKPKREGLKRNLPF